MTAYSRQTLALHTEYVDDVTHLGTCRGVHVSENIHVAVEHRVEGQEVVLALIGRVDLKVEVLVIMV